MRARTVTALVVAALLASGCSVVERVAGRPAEEAQWAVDPDVELTPEMTEIPLLVGEVGCASGRDAAGRISADVVGTDDALEITVYVEPLPGGQDCQGNPLTPYVLDLGEELGDRQLVNGAETEIARRPLELGDATSGDAGASPTSIDVESGVPDPVVFLAEALQVRARDHAELGADVTDLSPAPQGVDLYLGQQRVRTSTADQLREPDGWVLPVELYAGYAGPFSALERVGTAERLTLAAGPQPHCAGPPRPSPPELADLDRYALTPAGTDSCLQWFVVNLYVDDEGRLHAVQLDLWEP